MTKGPQLSDIEFFDFIERTGSKDKRDLVERIFKHLDDGSKKEYIEKIVSKHNAET